MEKEQKNTTISLTNTYKKLNIINLKVEKLIEEHQNLTSLTKKNILIENKIICENEFNIINNTLLKIKEELTNEIIPTINNKI